MCYHFRVLSRILTTFSPPALYFQQTGTSVAAWVGWMGCQQSSLFPAPALSVIFHTPLDGKSPSNVTHAVKVSSPTRERLGCEEQSGEEILRKYFSRASKGSYETPVRLHLLVIAPCSEIPPLNHLLLLELRRGLVSSPACAERGRSVSDQ